MKNQNRKSSSSSDQRTHRFWLSSSLSRGENEWTNWGGFSPLGGLETKARVCRRVRCRSQKGRAKRIETYLGGLARPLWSMGPLFTIHASTTLPRFLFRPHCPPEQHMAALYSSLSLQQDKQVQALSTLSRISITRRRVHARPKCSKRFHSVRIFSGSLRGWRGITGYCEKFGYRRCFDPYDDTLFSYYFSTCIIPISFIPLYFITKCIN